MERTGRKIQSQFPLNLWDGTMCGREQECITCYQLAENIPNYTRQSILYKNVSATCAPGARSKEPLENKDLEQDHPREKQGALVLL